jgi:rubrerythrin
MIEKLTVRRALEFAIKTEQLGAQFYDTQAKKHAGDEELVELFGILARDEEIHEAQFKMLLKKLPLEERRDLDPAEEEYLRAVATAEIFYGNNEALDPADKVETRQDAFARAMNMERASLMYYSAMRDVLGPSEVLDSIIQAEKEHMVKVMKYMFTGAKMRGLIDEQP